MDGKILEFTSRNFGYKITNSKLFWLRPIIEGWNNAIVTYCSHLPNDEPFAYNERANISLLAAGAWKSGSISLEEYSSEKRNDKENSKIYSGRSDLYIASPNNPQDNKFHDAVIEAKIAWLSIPIRRDVCKLLDDAQKDAKKNSDNGTRIGICFYPLKIPLSKVSKPKQAKDIARNSMKDFFNRFDDDSADLIAWSIPATLKPTPWGDLNDKPHYFPGVSMAMRLV